MVVKSHNATRQAVPETSQGHCVFDNEVHLVLVCIQTPFTGSIFNSHIQFPIPWRGRNQ